MREYVSPEICVIGLYAMTSYLQITSDGKGGEPGGYVPGFDFEKG